jgi:hypothetical protein
VVTSCSTEPKARQPNSLAYSVGPRHVRVHHPHQADRFALLGQLVIDAGVVAPESAHADHRDVNKVVRQL